MPSTLHSTPYFYPRPPRGGRQRPMTLFWSLCNFYPRPPRGGRPGTGTGCRRVCHFYPRPPRGGRHVSLSYCGTGEAISTHALREEGDTGLRPASRPATDFYPRPPRGGRQLRAKYRGVGGVISTHALREEGDWADRQTQRPQRYFYPRPPRGGRPRGPSLTSPLEVFLPTPSARRATRGRQAGGQRRAISTHALREEGDGKAMYHYYNPNPISTHALREEGDRFGAGEAAGVQISTHALREEGDPTPSPASESRS